METKGDKDWIDRISSLAGSIGLNATRVRWKLMRGQERWSNGVERQKLRFRHVGYEHKICTSCGSLQDRSLKVCDACGKRLLPRWLQIFGRLDLIAPGVISPTSLIITVILIAYYRSATFGGGNLLAPTSLGLIQYGASFPPAVFAGDWWRLATCILLHGGPIHILFNLMALQQVGPETESIFGKGRTLFYFMVTGLAASLGSALWRDGGIGIGASGALMGLIGVTAGWGQRVGGSAGEQARDMMIKWGLYTIVFGFLVGADNAAHIVGLASGFVIGLIARPQNDRRRSVILGYFETVLGLALFAAAVVYVNFPPSSVMDSPEILSPAVEDAAPSTPSF